MRIEIARQKQAWPATVVGTRDIDPGRIVGRRASNKGRKFTELMSEFRLGSAAQPPRCAQPRE